jgi:aminopeptidase N
MKLFQASLTSAGLVVAATAYASAPINLQEFHNPRFSAPIHESGFKNPEPVKESHPRFRPAKFDVLHYDIDVDVNPESGVIEGSVGVVVKSLVNDLKAIDLDAVNMQIIDVESMKQRLDFTYDGFIVTANLEDGIGKNETRFLRFRYRALTPQHLLLAGPDAIDPHRMQTAYTYTQPEGSSHWYPCLDRPADKATLSIKVAVPSGYNALSNGDLTDLTVGRTKTEFSYRMEFPVATYLVSLAIGNYEILDIGTFQNKKLTLWAPPSLYDAAVFETARTQEMMEVFADFTGVPYPFNSYATSVAQAYRASMEHQAATTMGDWRITGDGSGEGVVAHELAHQWFGDWITCRTWGELWLNEGYATYLPYVFFVATQDEVRALGQVEYWRDGYFAQAATHVHPLSSANPDMSNIFDSHAYEKGALTIHFMRWITNNLGSVTVNDGEEAYTKVLRHYLSSKAGGNVTNYDHESSLAAVTGQSWETVFDQWVRREGHPILDIKSSIANDTLT